MRWQTGKVTRTQQHFAVQRSGDIDVLAAPESAASASTDSVTAPLRHGGDAVALSYSDAPSVMVRDVACADDPAPVRVSAHFASVRRGGAVRRRMRGTSPCLATTQTATPTRMMVSTMIWTYSRSGASNLRHPRPLVP